MTKPQRDPAIVAQATKVTALVELISGFLHGHEDSVQGAALCDLLAMWLAGHFVANSVEDTRLFRERLLDNHIENLWKLVPINERRILQQVKEGSN